MNFPRIFGHNFYLSSAKILWKSKATDENLPIVTHSVHWDQLQSSVLLVKRITKHC